MRTVSNLMLILISACSLFACQNGKNIQKTGGDSTVADAKNGLSASAQQTIPFIVADHYFVNNTVNTVDNPKITTKSGFDKIFGEAAVMGKNGEPTSIDFTRQYVVAVVNPETDAETTLIPVGLQRDGSGDLIFTYQEIIGEKQSYIMKPCLLIIVDKKFDGNIRLKKIH